MKNKTSTTPQTSLNVHIIMKLEFDRAKLWWKRANISNIAIVTLSLAANLLPGIAPTIAAASTGLIIFSFVAQMISDSAKNNADWVLRQFEMWNGLGWAISKKGITDVLAKVPQSTRDSSKTPSQFQYFDSKRATSPKRMVENVMQSAFYSKIQAFFIAKVIFAASAAIVLSSIFTAAFALQNNLTDGQTLAYFLLTAVQLVVATGYVRLGMDYWQFGSTASVVEDRAIAIIGKRKNENDAIKLLHEYQIERSKSPLLPEWVWKVKENTLNDLWKQHRGGKTKGH